MIVVERATEEDFEAVLAIRAACGAESDVPEMLQAIRSRHLLVARRAGEHLGLALVHNHFFGQQFIDLVMVRPDARRQGVASALIAYVERTRPTEKLFTSTNESNRNMQALLEKLGYRRSGVVENLDDGDPELIYFKRLVRE